MAIYLETFGGLKVRCDGEELEWLARHRLRAALLVYVAVEEAVTRDSLAATFWPERDGERAFHALRQSLYHLRSRLGHPCLEAHGREIRVASSLRTDLGEFHASLQRDDLARAILLYQGPFLDGVHLADQPAWEQWVETRRSEAARAFRKACRSRIETLRTRGELEEAVEVAQGWVAPDPLDDEAQHELIAALAAAAGRVPALRQFEAYERALAAEGLSPLDRTLALAALLRSNRAGGADPDGASSGRRDPSPSLPAGRGPRQSKAPPRPRPPRFGLAASIAAGVVAALALGSLLFIHRSAENPNAPREEPPAAALDRDPTEPARRILVSDFSAPPEDPGLGETLTNMVHAEFLTRSGIQLPGQGEVTLALERMGHREGQPGLDDRLAREVALREGIPVVVSGEVQSVGDGFLLTATIRASASDRIIAAVRASAARSEDVLTAMQGLARDLGDRVEANLPVAEDVPELPRVATPSLDALRSYARAGEVFQTRDRDQGVALLRHALQADPDFAAAWLRLAYASGTRDRSGMMHAATRALALRHGLPERERFRTAAAAHLLTGDYPAAMASYHRLLALDPEDTGALNNLGLLLRHAGEFAAAAGYLERVVAQDAAPAVAYVNLIHTRLAMGDPRGALETAGSLQRRHPDAGSLPFARFVIHFRLDEQNAAAAAMHGILARPEASAALQARAHEYLGLLALWRGRLKEADERFHAAGHKAAASGDSHLLWGRTVIRAHAEAALGVPGRGMARLTDELDRRVGDPDRLPAQDPALLALEGISLGLVRERDGLAAILEDMEARDTPTAEGLAAAQLRGARALAPLLDGDPEEAVRTLETLRGDQACRYCLAKRMGWSLADAGRLQEAATEWEAVLAWKDELFHGLGPAVQIPQYLWTLERLAPLLEAMGETARALELYRELVDLWSDADPDLQPRVERARSRISALDPSGPLFRIGVEHLHPGGL